MHKKEPELKIAIAWNAFTACFEQSFEQKIPVLGKPEDLTNYDLIIFSGGEDISPAFYDGSRDLSFGINPERDTFERDTFAYCRQLGKKTLGVCRGHQLINAVMGARFVQDLRFVENINHSLWHSLQSIDSDFIGHFTSVNSMHHQGISTGGGRLRFTSFHGKGKSGNYIVESSENEHIVTTQFHPEFMENDESKEFFRKIKKWVVEKPSKKSKKYHEDWPSFIDEIRTPQVQEVRTRDIQWVTTEGNINTTINNNEENRNERIDLEDINTRRPGETTSAWINRRQEFSEEHNITLPSIFHDLR